MKDYMLDAEKIEELRSLRVVKSNELIQQARYTLTEQQAKLVAYTIAKIKPQDTELLEQQFSMREFCLVMGIKPVFNNYQQVEDNLLKITNAGFWLANDEKKITTRWFERVSIDKDKVITVKLDSLLTKHLIQLKDNFSKYGIYSFAPLNVMSGKLYELLLSYSHKRELVISVSDLMEALQTSYSRYNNFRAKIIEPAINEINDKTDIIVSYTPIKEGKFVKYLRFDIKKYRSSHTLELTEQINNYELNKKAGLLTDEE